MPYNHDPFTPHWWLLSLPCMTSHLEADSLINWGMLWFMSIFSAWLTRQQVAQPNSSPEHFLERRKQWRIIFRNHVLSNSDYQLGLAIHHFDFFVHHCSLDIFIERFLLCPTCQLCPVTSQQCGKVKKLWSCSNQLTANPATESRWFTLLWFKDTFVPSRCLSCICERLLLNVITDDTAQQGMSFREQHVRGSVPVVT